MRCAPRLPWSVNHRVWISNVSVSIFLSWSLSLQVFRTDLITAMKLHDSFQLNPDEYYVLADPWRQEWEKGVQVPVSPGSIPEPVAWYSLEECKQIHFFDSSLCLCCFGFLSFVPHYLARKSNVSQLSEWLQQSRIGPLLPMCWNINVRESFLAWC